MRGCSDCEFWKCTNQQRATAIELVDGECRRSEPRVFDLEQVYGIWPVTRGGDWCGAFCLGPYDEEKTRTTGGQASSSV